MKLDLAVRPQCLGPFATSADEPKAPAPETQDSFCGYISVLESDGYCAITVDGAFSDPYEVCAELNKAFAEAGRRARLMVIDQDEVDVHRWVPFSERLPQGPFEDGQQIELKKHVPVFIRDWCAERQKWVSGNNGVRTEELATAYSDWRWVR